MASREGQAPPQLLRPLSSLPWRLERLLRTLIHLDALYVILAIGKPNRQSRWSLYKDTGILSLAWREIGSFSLLLVFLSLGLSLSLHSLLSLSLSLSLSLFFSPCLSALSLATRSRNGSPPAPGNMLTLSLTLSVCLIVCLCVRAHGLFCFLWSIFVCFCS